MRLSVVVPAFNEAKRIVSTLESILEFCRRELSEWEVIVVDDGSSDGTSEVVSSFPDVRCLRNDVNRGKGQSVRRGMLAATLDPVLFTDADLSTPIHEALPLLRAIDEGADLAIASRQKGAKAVTRTPLRRFLGLSFQWLVRALVLRGIHDTQCGFKMFRRDVVREVFPIQHLEGWAFDVEILFLARMLGYTIREVPVEWHEARSSRIRWSTPARMFADLLRIRWYQLSGRYRRLARPPS
jgi:dolichyl-phosphate beta-glucosyltransferase